MEACIAVVHGNPVILSLRDGIVYLDDEPQPIKNLGDSEIADFVTTIQNIPYSVDPGYQALLNAKRAEFIAGLLGKAVGEDCINHLTHILDHVHYDVLEYLGETGEDQ